MLIKARIAAGDRRAGAALLDFVEPLIYQSSLDFRAVEAVSETRQRIHESWRARRRRTGGFDIKLAPAASAISSFWCSACSGCTAGANRGCGTAAPCWRCSGCATRACSPSAEYARLATAYEFLRHLEHRLQFDEDLQTHTLPTDLDALDLLARKMPPPEARPDGDRRDAAARPGRTPGGRAGDLRARDPRPEADVLQHAGGARPPNRKRMPTLEPPPSSLVRFLDQRAPRLAQRGRRQRCTAAASGSSISSRKLFAEPGDAGRGWTGTPRWRAACSIFSSTAPISRTICCAIRSCWTKSGRRCAWQGEPLADAASLRRFYRRQMLRIQRESMLEGAPIFDTLEELRRWRIA